MFKLPFDIYEINVEESGIGCGKSLFTEHKLIPEFSGKKVLDIGFGSGELLKYLYSLGNEIYGIDVGEASMKSVNTRGLKGEFLKLDASTSQLPWPENFFDIVFATECMEHMDNPLHAILEIKRTLKDGGELYVSIPEFEDKFGFHGGKHSYIYPGLFQRESIRWFFTMSYYSILRYREHGGTAQYHLLNRKSGVVFLDPFTVVKGNVYATDIYGWLDNQKWLNSWKELEYREMEHIRTNLDLPKAEPRGDDYVAVSAHLLSKRFYMKLTGGKT